MFPDEYLDELIKDLMQDEDDQLWTAAHESVRADMRLHAAVMRRIDAIVRESM